MAVLVTGAAGFIGSHVVQALLRAGRSVVGMDNLYPSYDPHLKERNVAAIRQTAEQCGAPFSLDTSSICDPRCVRRVFAEFPFRAVIHLAARAGVRPSLTDPLGYARTNIEGTLCLLEEARRHKGVRFIFTSSSSVYGDPPVPCFTEDLPVRPLSPYAATKVSGEVLCHTYHDLYGLPVLILRLFTVYGPRQRPDLAISTFVRLLLAGEPLPIYGDGSSSRDYTYVDDTVAGILAAEESSLSNEIINLGSGRPVHLRELISTLEHITGRQAVLEELPRQPGEVLRTCANTDKAGQLLGWQPQVDLLSGLQRYVEWLEGQNSPP
jgi:UDP-glucuronate 4-epimerase